jgi:predicted metal-dependent peptidase
VAPPIDRTRIAAARLWASTRLPYLASALFASTVVAVPDCNTISVDRGWQVSADPVWVERLDVEEIGRLLVHHVGHLLRGHAERATQAGVEAGANAERWNRCADAEINDDLAVDGLVPRVAPDVPPDLDCLEFGLAENYYAAASDGPRHWDCGSGCDNIPRPWEGTGGIDRNQRDLLCLSVAADIHRHHGQRPGTVPGGWLRWAERVLPSRTDWRRALAAEIRHGVAAVAGNVDYTYRRPSRRVGAAPRVVMPSLQRPIPDVAIVCDTSGSMHEQLLARALAEVEGILTRAGLRQQRVRVLAVDTNVHAVRRVSRASQVELAGGGGTDMGQGIAAAAALRPRPSVIIVLTDGFTPWPDRSPRGIRVVVGLLVQSVGPYASYPPPAWARTIVIEPVPAAR